MMPKRKRVMSLALALYFLLLSFLQSALVIVVAEQSCELDGTCSDGNSDRNPSNKECVDLMSDCESLASQGECRNNQKFMLQVCRKTCRACEGEESMDEEHDYGVPQHFDETYSVEINQAIQDMKDYFRAKRKDPNTKASFHKILDNCKNQHQSCTYWKVIGECDVNPDYMKKNCAAICQSCEHLSYEFRCPLDPDAPDAWKAGDLHSFFLNITTRSEFARYEPNILSRPDFIPGDTNETADYMIGPWVVTLDNFVSKEEAERLIQLGAEEGYKRSSDVGEMKFDGTFEEKISDGRTSLNAWCKNSCYNDTLAKQVIAKIEAITNIPETNSEHLQLLKYEVGQYYRQHHDFISIDNKRQPGVRILTVFLYLNDVEAGGGTNFPFLNLTVMPKRGRVLIWPSVLDSHPTRIDRRTEHQALPVEKGIKYGANAWLHQRDFKTPHKNGCH